MRVSTLAIAAFTGFAAAAPYYPFPLADGFPNPSPAQLKKIETLAGGSLPGGALAPKLTAVGAATLQLIALNEAFEVAYFNQLLTNVTENKYGFNNFNPAAINQDYAIKALTSIRNQEELHYLGVNAALAAAKQETIALCKYNIPAIPNFEAGIALANTFTDVVLGVLPQAQTVFAADGGDELAYVNLFGSVIAQEAEQNGWYRAVQKKIPSAAPFLTTEGPQFAFTFLKSVIAPGCPGVDLVSKSVPTFKPLSLVSSPTGYNEMVTFSVEGRVDSKNNAVVYISGQNAPANAKIYAVTYKGGVSTFKANFPYQGAGFARGLTIAAVVNTNDQMAYASPADVAKHTIYGPGIIEIN